MVGADVPAQQGLQVGDAVDASGVALLADDQHGQDQGHGLGDDGEVHPTHTALEHRKAHDEGQQRGYHQHRDQGQGQALEGRPPPRQGGQLVPVHEVRDARGGLDLRADGVRRFQLQEHGHAVPAQAEEHALAQAEDARMPPQHDQAQRNEGVRQVLADEVEPEDVQGQREDHDQQQGQQEDAAKLLLAHPRIKRLHDETPGMQF